MNAGMLWYLVVGAIALALTRVYVRREPRKKPDEPPQAKRKEPPRWHKWFDDPA